MSRERPNIATPDELHRAYCGRYTAGREGDVHRCEHGVIYYFDGIYSGRWHVLRRPRWYSFYWTKTRWQFANEQLDAKEECP